MPSAVNEKQNDWLSPKSPDVPAETVSGYSGYETVSSRPEYPFVC